MEERDKADFFRELDKALLKDYKEEIEEFGKEANRPSIWKRLEEGEE